MVITIMSTICELAKRFSTDKEPGRHNYTPVYSCLTAGKTIRDVLEIGIGGGESLRLWEAAFPEAEIWGIDNDASRMINDGRIHSRLCDQGDGVQLGTMAREFREQGKRFDLIIDDGSHDPSHQVISANTLIPLLANGGVYVIEDVSIEGKERVQRGVAYPSRMVELNLEADSCSRLIIVENRQ
jgi:predicted O-methyltransferase YrrM